MARKSKPLISPSGGAPSGGDMPTGFVKGFDRYIAVQRPAVLAYIRGLRRRNPDASPAQVIRILERRYLATVTTSGATVGATAVIPGVGTGITLALSGVETAGFLEATALFAQSISEVHGLAVDDPDRARALVMTMMLGREGSDLVRQLAGQAQGIGVGRSSYWGELVTANMPRAIMGPLTDRLRKAFIKQFTAKGSASFIGKAIPFGVGAVIGGGGNHILGKRVVHSSRLAFGTPPNYFRTELDPKARLVRVRNTSHSATQTNQVNNIVGATTRRLSAIGSGVMKAVPKVKPGALMQSIRHPRTPQGTDKTVTPPALPPENGSGQASGSSQTPDSGQTPGSGQTP